MERFSNGEDSIPTQPMSNSTSVITKFYHFISYNNVPFWLKTIIAAARH